MDVQCIHEIAKATCVHCRPRRRVEFEEEVPGPLFQAQFRGYCAGCHNQVDIGDDLRMWDGLPYHTFCLPERFLEEFG